MKVTSPSTGEECTPAQLLAEIMVKREADKSKINLPYKFWNNEPWKKKYKQQIIAANGLLRVYDLSVILSVLKRKDCSWQYSLRANGIASACAEEQIKFDKKQKLIEQNEQIEVKDTESYRHVSTGKQTKKSRLD